MTEIKVKLVEDRGDRLQAFATITFDNQFVVRDLKIIEGSRGPFVAMPSRKLADRCPKCKSKNHLRARHCNECGAKLDENRFQKRGGGGRTKLHADIAHPINSECRALIQTRVLEAFGAEKQKSKQPGYKPAACEEDLYDIYDTDDLRDDEIEDPAPRQEKPWRRERETRTQPREEKRQPVELRRREEVAEKVVENRKEKEEVKEEEDTFGEGIFD